MPFIISVFLMSAIISTSFQIGHITTFEKIKNLLVPVIGIQICCKRFLLMNNEMYQTEPDLEKKCVQIPLFPTENYYK